MATKCYNAYINALWAFTLLSATQGLSDNRCYLENGASSENFFVSENNSVGSIIGQIRVHGDPRPGGTIALHLKETDSPVAISPGTKNLTLRRKLDKEGVEGPSSVFVNLICERLHTLDPGFVIPVNIRVTDANDNSPVFINAPYVLNISEVTVVGTRVLQGVHAVDNDQQGPFSSVKYSVLPGPHSDYFEFENELEGTLVLKKPLDYETLKSFDVNIRAQDHGEPPRKTDTVLTVHVVDADDQNPRFLDDRYTASVPEPPKRGSPLVAKPREIKAFDQDLGINAPIFYTFNGIGTDYTYFKINRNSGKVTLSRDLNDSDLQHPATLVIRATQQDNPDRYALATLTVSREVGNGIRFLHRIFYIKVPESTPVGATISTFTNNRPNQHLRYFVSDQNVLKTFAINTKGELSLKKKLDFEDKAEYFFKVFATDGITNDSSVVNVTVQDVNEWEPRFRYPHYEFFVTGQPNELIGRIEAADGDKNDKLTLTLTGVNASNFFITPSGELRLREAGPHSGVANLAVVATDSGNPPRRASVPVTVHFPDSGDAAGIISSRGNNGAPLLLAGLGAILLLLAFVIALLVAYICKAKRNPRQELPTLQPEKAQGTPAVAERMSNPMFGDRVKSPMATAMGGIPSDLVKSRIPSPKVHPAPQPPAWPSSTSSTRTKKLSWGDDKTDSDSTDNINNIDTTPKLIDNSNLTVYF
ncbi:protocadherin beta-12 [Tribolium castaneum]|uniref:protocadherin beta-12 n=1 Tax=Tribolium castaneum TaxID=7070 RepID=UPI00017582CC|nr:PREDICTED: protocadherin beta-12 [Tribolium castaneum]XP_972608.2 PREDICTED: protocadherin beta-12 [Tribolium castaneum]|eukprot:XP_015835493.1 PREDICTED: protocadherin beta-12 [Tribolium castaneum]